MINLEIFAYIESYYETFFNELVYNTRHIVKFNRKELTKSLKI
jgi:hypothetical protein